jgi:imidazoleglycerol-phosphate dehydratase
MRTATLERRTNETQIQVNLNLDGSGQYDVSTGVGFLDHLLRHVAVHGLIDLTVRAQGDLEIDAHHTIEDVALVLGACLDQAVGDRKGLARLGHAYAPMDESLAFVALDLSGRPYAVIEADWRSPAIGQMPTTLVPHFLESLAATARMNLHARVLYGRDDHHQAEALFKALGRALELAVRLDPRRAGSVPSTKGTLVNFDHHNQ